MKTKFLLLFFITLAISGIVLGETLNKGIRIELKHHLRKDHRSVIEQPFQVFLISPLLSIEQDPSLSDELFYTVRIKDVNTGKIMETLTTAGTTYINISNLIPAEYNIEIDLESMLLYGTFVIQK